MILDSSMVEHTAVNRGVVGSSPTRGAWESPVNVRVYRILLYLRWERRILEINVLLTEKCNPQFNEIVTLVRIRLFFTVKMADFHSSLYKAEMAT